MPARYARKAPTQAQFHEAIAASGDRWYAACLGITRNRALAEDAVQEALLSAWAKRAQFQHTAKLDTWIHRIAINAALQALRKQRPGAWLPLEIDVVSDAPTPVEARSEEEFGRDMNAALEHLSDLERVCFVLKHVEQWRLKEIAAELTTGVGTVKQALFRALAKLRVSLADRRSEVHE